MHKRDSTHALRLRMLCYGHQASMQMSSDMHVWEGEVHCWCGLVSMVKPYIHKEAAISCRQTLAHRPHLLSVSVCSQAWPSDAQGCRHVFWSAINAARLASEVM